ncbi:unnamed protein product [Bursaphelenchus xylophilus]|uniref:(pine wood nematode) hypothetical protein n=1 Tax=Bursaphelenchus xylophilus TaxID=6326 RepID=A0A1I7RN59_BURXY|nr:unnamed protein product [Bursaphelenchus xylophilus]CAG9087729.1 unnamed protein product [Bursaphelenchus xylophilus]
MMKQLPGSRASKSSAVSQPQASHVSAKTSTLANPPATKRVNNDTLEFKPPLVMAVIQSTSTMAVAVADVRAVHAKQSLPGPVVFRNPPMECNLPANIRVSSISKLPNRPHTSLGEEIKLSATTISYLYVAEKYELIEQDRQVKTVLGLLSEVPGHTVAVSSKGQRKLKRKPVQFVIPNPAKTITIQNGFVTSDIQLTSEVGTPAKVEIIQIQPEMSQTDRDRNKRSKKISRRRIGGLHSGLSNGVFSLGATKYEQYANTPEFIQFGTRESNGHISMPVGTIIEVYEYIHVINSESNATILRGMAGCRVQGMAGVPHPYGITTHFHVNFRK